MESRPVLTTDAVIRDHLDLVIGPADRAKRSLWLLFCDDHAEPMLHAAIDDVPLETPIDECVRVLTPFAEVLVDVERTGCMLVALARPGPARVQENDRRWFRAVHQVCRPIGVTVLGVYLATPRETTPIHLDDA